jgi:hypothetical protein
MTRKTRSLRPSPALVISCVALFLALAGSAFAVGVAKNSVRSPQIVDGTVRTADLRDNSVNPRKIAPDAVTVEEIAENAVESPEVAPDALTAGDLGAASVTSSEVADQSLTGDDLGANSVGSSEIQAGAIRAAELGTIIQVSNSAEVKDGKNVTVEVACPAGTTVISGGGFSAKYLIHMSGSFRFQNGWRVDAHNGSGADSSVTAYAYCLTGGSSN